MTFFDGSDQIGNPVTLSTSKGVTTATLVTSLSVLGQHTITVTYNGDRNYTTNSGSTTESVLLGSATTVTAQPSPSMVGQAVTFTATVVSTSPGSTGTPPAR